MAELQTEQSKSVLIDTNIFLEILLEQEGQEECKAF